MAAAQVLGAANRRQAAYFCQQVAEKIARSILDHAAIPFGTGHNLSQMAQALPEAHSWRAKLKSLDKHSPAATKFRYPLPSGRLLDPPSASLVRSDIEELKALLAEARGFVGATRSDQFKSSHPAR